MEEQKMTKGELARRAALDLIVVHRLRCRQCGSPFLDGVSTSDTDMAPVYLNSVCTSDGSALAIAELTAEEFTRGCRSMPRRIERHIPNKRFVYVDFRRKCPLCGGTLEEEDVAPLRKYLTEKDVYLLYFNEDGQETMEQITTP